MNSYYNTNGLHGKDAIISNKKASKQDDEVLRVFRLNNRKLSPDEVWKMAFEYRNIPITSVRRAITNLTIKDELQKLGKDDMIIGIYGKPVHTWKLNRIDGKNA